MAVSDRGEVAARVARIRDRIEEACARAGRDTADVRIVAAAKTVPVERVRWAVEAGIRDVGENYVQELRAKREHLPDLSWHFLGTLQSGSAHHVAALADVVHTLRPGRAAERLARRAAEAGRGLPCLVEVDFAERGTGVPPAETLGAADRLADLPGIDLVGLMTLPPIPASAQDARPWFARLRELRDRLAEHHPRAVELSMGMSLDYAVAVEEGATMVRIGTALFGERPT